MGLFDELDVASAADNPFGGVPEGVYECTVTNAVVKESDDKFYREGVKKVGLMLTYKVTDGDEAGEEITEYKAIPRPEDKDNPTSDERRAMSFLKQRMLSLGIPENRVNSVEPDDLIGLDCYVTVKKGKNDYMNVTEVKLVNQPATFV